MNVYGLAAVIGLTAITVITRGLFLIPKRDLPMPAWLQRGLRYAPLAALVAVVAPEIVLSHGQLVSTWMDPRLPAVAVSTGYYCWRRSILGTIVSGTAVLLVLKLVFAW
jgi:branched-subunit amino acid transport protein